MQVVFDTNVLLSATLWQGSVAQKLLAKLVATDAKFFTSSQILSEYQKVLKRDFNTSDEEIASRTTLILSFTKLVQVSFEIKAVLDDQEDDKILECAKTCSADYIITYDRHLLKLRQYENIQIRKPEEIIGNI